MRGFERKRQITETVTAQLLLPGRRMKNKNLTKSQRNSDAEDNVPVPIQPNVVNQLAEYTDLLHNGLCLCVNLPASSSQGFGRKEKVGQGGVAAVLDRQETGRSEARHIHLEKAC